MGCVKQCRKSIISGGLILVLGIIGCAGERGAGHGEGWSTARVESLNAAMPGLLREFAVPGVAIVLIESDRLRWASGYGVTSSGGTAVSPETIFQVASLGKPVFAQLVDSLAREQGWNLRGPIAEWAAVGSYPRDLGSLSAETILSHTSGLAYDPGSDRIRLDAQHRGEWRYSGAAYALLQRAVEGTMGAGLESIAQDRLFGPLGLESMGFHTPPASEVARGHARDGESSREIDWSDANAGSSLHASATDYARFLIHSSGLGSTAPLSWERMTAPRVTVRGDLGLKWGLGWAMEQAPSGDTVVFHWGSNPGFKSFAFVDRGRDIGIVILTNGDNGLELAEQAVGIVDPNPHPLFDFYMLHPDD